jgi:hypothetical protein
MRSAIGRGQVEVQTADNGSSRKWNGSLTSQHAWAECIACCFGFPADLATRQRSQNLFVLSAAKTHNKEKNTAADNRDSRPSVLTAIHRQPHTQKQQQTKDTPINSLESWYEPVVN